MFLKKKKFHKNEKMEELMREIECVKKQMENAYQNFQYAMDPDLIDCYIYESNAACKRYHFLLRQAKNSHEKQRV